MHLVKENHSPSRNRLWHLRSTFNRFTSALKEKEHKSRANSKSRKPVCTFNNRKWISLKKPKWAAELPQPKSSRESFSVCVQLQQEASSFCYTVYLLTRQTGQTADMSYFDTDKILHHMYTKKALILLHYTLCNQIRFYRVNCKMTINVLVILVSILNFIQFPLRLLEVRGSTVWKAACVTYYSTASASSHQIVSRFSFQCISAETVS